MKFIYPTAIAASMTILLSCGDAPEVDFPEINNSIQQGEDKDLTTPIEVTWDQLSKRDFERGQVVTFKSFVSPLSSTLYYSGGEIPLNFHQRRHQSEGFHLRVDVPIGTKKNQIKSIPEKYNAREDLIIYSNDGGKIKVGDHVQITGVWSKATADDYDYLDLTEIKVLENDASDESFKDGAEELTDAMIESDADVIHSYVDGTMKLSMFMFSYDQTDYSIDLDQSNNKYLTKADVMIGDGPSTMNSLGDNFVEKDFIVRDYAGTEMEATGKKFRLYGTFKKTSYNKDQKGTFKVEEIVAL